MDTPRAVDAEQRISEDQWDIDAWQTLATEAENSAFTHAKPIYERLVAQFPPIGRFWKSYAEHMARELPNDQEPVKEVYERAVLVAPTSIEVWRSYLSYNTALAAKVPASKLEADALAVHEKAVTAAGLDLNANPLWSLYIEFLKKHTTLSDSQRRDALRRVYQRAVRNPMQNLDTFWREYSTFEQTNNTNKDLARGLIAENQPKNIDARAEFRARRSRREGLTLTTLPGPPRGRAKESSQAQQWRRFIAQERSNPFTLAEPDLHGRVAHAFESSLVPMYRYADFWIEYLSYIYGCHIKDGDSTAGKTPSKEHSNASGEDSPVKKAAAALEPLLVRAGKALPDNVALHSHMYWLYARIGAASKGVAAMDTLCRRHPSPLAYVQLMRSTRKTEGRDAARKVFGRARKDAKGADPVVYVAAALMEFSVNKDSKVARNVFEFGLKNYAKNALMALEYVNWLWGLGDFEYTRVVLKKVMPDVKGKTETVRRLWERWLELEEIIGDSGTVDQVELMWKESGVGRSGGVVQDVLRRSRFLGLEGLGEEDMAVIEGARNGGGEKTGGNGTGKRDPRTGRRVVSSSGGKEGGNSGGTSRRVREGNGLNTPMKTATEWLQRMAASMPPIAALPPTPEVLFRMIMDTPESFGDTPAGASSNNTMGQKGEQQSITGKKRKGEELGRQNVENLSTVSPAQDVFRARQAAKQSRMR